VTVFLVDDLIGELGALLSREALNLLRPLDGVKFTGEHLRRRNAPAADQPTDHGSQRG
jgi:hypothetical protein